MLMPGCKNRIPVRAAIKNCRFLFCFGLSSPNFAFLFGRALFFGIFRRLVRHCAGNGEALKFPVAIVAQQIISKENF
jgi:hypothetical protein